MENLVNNSEEQHVIYSNSSNIKFTPYSDGNDVIDKLFKSFCSLSQENLETSIKERDFIFDSVQLLYYKYHKVSFSCDGLYIDSPE